MCGRRVVEDADSDRERSEPKSPKHSLRALWTYFRRHGSAAPADERCRMWQHEQTLGTRSSMPAAGFANNDRRRNGRLSDACPVVSRNVGWLGVTGISGED